MSIAPITNGDENARAKMNAAIAEANKVAGKAEQASLVYEVAERKAADAAEASARAAGLAAEAIARDVAIRRLPFQKPSSIGLATRRLPSVCHCWKVIRSTFCRFRQI